MKNKYRIEDDIVYIELNRKDGIKLETMIDLEDFNLANEFKSSWYSRYSKDTKSYYCVGSLNNTTIQLHRIIMNLNDPKLKIDHIYHNTLDNRKSQLRIVTHQENLFNYKDRKGYYWDKRANKWKATVYINGKQKYLGHFKTEEEARNIFENAKGICYGIGENKKSEEEISEFEKSIKKEPKGYYWHKQIKKYHSQIKINGKRKSLGLYDTEEEAKEAYLKAKKIIKRKN